MKKILTILAIVCVAFIFAGCQKDGVYNPSKKISKVYYTSTNGKKSLDQIWNWNEKLLDKIDFYYNGAVEETYRFYYDNNRLTRMDRYAYGNILSIEYKYDGSHLSEADVFHSGSLNYIYKFSYKSGKLESMTCTSTSKGVKEETKIHPLYFVFGPEISQCIEKSEKTLAKKHNGKSISTETYKFTWKNGEVSQCVLCYQEEDYSEYTYKYTYDKKKNPFSGALINLYPEENMLFDGSLCKHNITKIDFTSMEGESEIIKFDYSYKDNYPISKRETVIEGGETETGGLYEYEYMN